MKILTKLIVPALVVIGVVLLVIGLRPSEQTSHDHAASAAESAMAIDARKPAPTTAPSADVPAQPAPSSTAAASAAASPTRPASASPSAVASGEEPYEGDDLVDVPVPAASTAALDPLSVAVVAAAEKATRAYARPVAGVTAQQWWAGVEPLLAPQTAQDYAGTNPARVPYTKVTGAGVLMTSPEGEAGHLVDLVQVPTDAGVYEVRVRPIAPYPVLRISPAGR